MTGHGFVAAQPDAPAVAGLPATWARRLVSSAGDATAPLDRPAGMAPGGVPWLVEYALDGARGAELRARLERRPWSMWRYRELLPLARFDERVDLGEGGTPLLRLDALAPPDVELWVKDEAGNPTGSFKARGLSLAVNRARELGAPGVELASAGNAALAAAAYAAAAGLPCRVAVPQMTPPGIAARCRALGAEVLTGGATLVEAAAELGAGEKGYWSLATLREPYRAEGKKTMGLEIAEQLGWRLPDWVVYPTGGGTGIVGMHKAFGELARLGLLEAGARTRFAAVQMEGCAPIVEAFRQGRPRARPWPRPATRVWGLRVPSAVGDFLVLEALRRTGGEAVAVSEREVEACRERLGRHGREWGPEGAATLAASQRLRTAGRILPGQSVVLFQTGDPANYS